MLLPPITHLRVAMFLEFLTFCSYSLASSAFIGHFLLELWSIQLAPFFWFYKWGRKHLETSLRSLSACAQAQMHVCLTLKPVLLMTFMPPQWGVPSWRKSRVICSMGILQARTLKWVAVSFCREPSWPRDWTCVSYVHLHQQAVSLTLVPCRKPVDVQSNLLTELMGVQRAGDSLDSSYRLAFWDANQVNVAEAGSEKQAL